jgi:hypothetical protein
MTSLEERIRALITQALHPVRSCALCGGDLSEPGTAAPILEPGLREGPPEANWTCLDGRTCDQREAARLRNAFPPSDPMGWLFGRMADTMRPEPLQLERGQP